MTRPCPSGSAARCIELIGGGGGKGAAPMRGLLMRCSMPGRRRTGGPGGVLRPFLVCERQLCNTGAGVGTCSPARLPGLLPAHALRWRVTLGRHAGGVMGVNVVLR
jgi:hypothetical protein